MELSFDNWSRKLLDLLYTINNNSRFYINALRTSYSTEFKEHIHKESARVFVDVIEDIAGKNTVTLDDKRFIAEFFSYGITGSVVAWVDNGMKDDPETIVAHIVNLVEDCKKLAIKRYMNS